MLSDHNGMRKDGAYVGLTQGSKAVRKRSVRYPPVPVPDVWHRTIAERKKTTYFFVPVTTQSSPSFTATVWMPATSLPANASVMASAMYFFPPRISGTYRDWISGDPKLRMGGRAMTPPFNNPSTKPRVPKRASSRLRMSYVRKKVEYERHKTSGRHSASEPAPRKNGRTLPA